MKPCLYVATQRKATDTPERGAGGGLTARPPDRPYPVLDVPQNLSVFGGLSFRRPMNDD
jgi:hypothetical protein